MLLRYVMNTLVCAGRVEFQHRGKLRVMMRALRAYIHQSRLCRQREAQAQSELMDVRRQRAQRGIAAAQLLQLISFLPLLVEARRRQPQVTSTGHLLRQRHCRSLAVRTAARPLPSLHHLASHVPLPSGICHAPGSRHQRQLHPVHASACAVCPSWPTWHAGGMGDVSHATRMPRCQDETAHALEGVGFTGAGWVWPTSDAESRVHDATAAGGWHGRCRTGEAAGRVPGHHTSSVHSDPTAPQRQHAWQRCAAP